MGSACLSDSNRRCVEGVGVEPRELLLTVLDVGLDVQIFPVAAERELPS